MDSKKNNALIIILPTERGSVVYVAKHRSSETSTNTNTNTTRTKKTQQTLKLDCIYSGHQTTAYEDSVYNEYLK